MCDERSRIVEIYNCVKRLSNAAISAAESEQNTRIFNKDLSHLAAEALARAFVIVFGGTWLHMYHPVNKGTHARSLSLSLSFSYLSPRFSSSSSQPKAHTYTPKRVCVGTFDAAANSARAQVQAAAIARVLS